MAAVLCVPLLTGCKDWYRKDKQELSTIVCDASFQNILEQEIEVYEFIYYPNAHVVAYYDTEAAAIDSLLSLKSRTIVIPRDLTQSEKNALKKRKRTARSQKIAVDAIALIVNPANTACNALSKREIADILSGSTTKWDEVEPAYADNPAFKDKDIMVLFDNNESSMVSYMRSNLLGGKSLGPAARNVGSIQNVLETVKENRYAIGVIGVTWLTTDLKGEIVTAELAAEAQDETVDLSMDEINDRIKNSGVKVLGVFNDEYATAFKPFQQYIYDGRYPLFRSIYMITTAPTGSAGGKFFSFVTGYVGQKLLMKTGILPARMPVNVVTLE